MKGERQGVVLFSSFLFAAGGGPPVQELDPRPRPGPHPSGSRTGRARQPPALSQEVRQSSGKEPPWGRKHGNSISTHPPKPRVLEPPPLPPSSALGPPHPCHPPQGLPGRKCHQDVQRHVSACRRSAWLRPAAPSLPAAVQSVPLPSLLPSCCSRVQPCSEATK